MDAAVWWWYRTNHEVLFPAGKRRSPVLWKHRLPGRHLTQEHAVADRIPFPQTHQRAAEDDDADEAETAGSQGANPKAALVRGLPTSDRAETIF